MSRISIVVPVYNEAKNVPVLFERVSDVLTKTCPDLSFEIIFVNDGSRDDSLTQLTHLENAHPETVRVLDFSRNFGKEAATTAGIRAATGDLILSMDADLQHPPELIPKFIEKWRNGAEVVIGVRKNDASDTRLKRMGSRLFYKLIRAVSQTDIVPRATDFRLIDRGVADEFNALTERSRMTRGLIDWLGFRRAFIPFTAPDRLHGTASYDMKKLVSLALESLVAHSLFPLRLAGYIGITIIILSSILGIVMLLDRYLFVWGLSFSGPAILANVILFLVGVVLVSLGLLAFYIAHIHTETQNRPLYIIRKKR